MTELSPGALPRVSATPQGTDPVTLSLLHPVLHLPLRNTTLLAGGPPQCWQVGAETTNQEPVCVRRSGPRCTLPSPLMLEHHNCILTPSRPQTAWGRNEEEACRTGVGEERSLVLAGGG